MIKRSVVIFRPNFKGITPFSKFNSASSLWLCLVRSEIFFNWRSRLSCIFSVPLRSTRWLFALSGCWELSRLLQCKQYIQLYFAFGVARRGVNSPQAFLDVFRLFKPSSSPCVYSLLFWVFLRCLSHLQTPNWVQVQFHQSFKVRVHLFTEPRPFFSFFVRTFA